MKVLLGAVSAMLIMAGAAVAQTTPETPATPAVVAPPSRCPAVATAPTPPDGATATAEQIQTATAAYETWRLATVENLACRRQEALELQAAVQARVQEFNAANQAAAAAGAAMQAQVEAYNARGGRRRTR